MGPLIDTELEKIDRKHMTIMELNQKLVDALQMYHSLMKIPPMAGGEDHFAWNEWNTGRVVLLYCEYSRIPL